MFAFQKPCLPQKACKAEFPPEIWVPLSFILIGNRIQFSFCFQSGEYEQLYYHYFHLSLSRFHSIKCKLSLIRHFVPILSFLLSYKKLRIQSPEEEFAGKISGLEDRAWSCPPSSPTGRVVSHYKFLGKHFASQCLRVLPETNKHQYWQRKNIILLFIFQNWLDNNSKNSCWSPSSNWYDAGTPLSGRL